jgi:hypothetical protein
MNSISGEHAASATVDDAPERRISGPELERAVERALVLAFAPMHKRIFATATGIAAALIVAIATLVAVLSAPADTGLYLLKAYFRGYDVTWPGILIGGAWAGMVGFVGGWFLAFVRNFTLATWLLYVRVRANMAQTRDFLDHI